MKITILTLFPDMFAGPLDLSIVKRAREKGLLDITIRNIRDFGIGKHRLVDDTPYGGGIGMIMRVDVLHTAITAVKENLPQGEEKVVLLSAKGRSFVQGVAKEYASLRHLILICGHYEGVDERITDYIDEEVSIGDFITTGGEIPAMIIIDAVTRLLPGVLKEGATEHESFSLQSEEGKLLEYPHYTVPQVYNGITVPNVLLQGNHKKINEYRTSEAKRLTIDRRSDLLKKRG